jgi:threonine aldolase
MSASHDTPSGHNAVIADFRSDTVTHPTPAMKDAMMNAPLGDDVYGDDPTTNALEEKAASLLGKDDAVFMPTGTQSNLASVMAHCERGDEYIVGETFHIYVYEAGGTSVLGSTFPHPLPVSSKGALYPDDVVAAIKENDSHFPITKLICVENTVNGCVHDVGYMDMIGKTAHDHGLKAHCDGARLFNAAVAQNVEPARLVKAFDTVSVCLSKGLGTPAGSILVGDDAAITKARRLRKMLGGGMRQTGILAAAGLHALDHHITRLQDDHARASNLADALMRIDGLSIDHDQVETNMIFVTFGTNEKPVSDDALSHLNHFMISRGLKINGERKTRLVTHLDIDDNACTVLIETLNDFINHYAG